jgi:Cu(I)/Ag(I) efflux system membrane protein CusA/SilA
MKLVNILAAALLVASGATQAQTAQGTPSKPVKEAKGDQGAAGALTDAVVRRIDSARGEVILKHGDIPNLAMPPMTMAFAAEPTILGRFKTGDKVRFHAEIVNGKPTVTHMEAVR